MLIEFEGFTAAMFSGGPYSQSGQRHYVAHVSGCSAEGCRYGGRPKRASTLNDARELAAASWRVHVKTKHQAWRRRSQ